MLLFFHCVFGTWICFFCWYSATKLKCVCYAAISAWYVLNLGPPASGCLLGTTILAHTGPAYLWVPAGGHCPQVCVLKPTLRCLLVAVAVCLVCSSRAWLPLGACWEPPPRAICAYLPPGAAGGPHPQGCMLKPGPPASGCLLGALHWHNPGLPTPGPE